jgi:hypothetical protein
VVGLTDGKICLGGLFGLRANSYAINIPINPNGHFYQFFLAGERHLIEFSSDGGIRPEQKETGNVVGCGILMNPDEKLTIFFTLNGILIGSVLIFFYLNLFICTKTIIQVANFQLIRRWIIYSQLPLCGMIFLWKQISATIRPNALNTTSKNALGWDWNGFEKPNENGLA